MRGEMNYNFEGRILELLVASEFLVREKCLGMESSRHHYRFSVDKFTSGFKSSMWMSVCMLENGWLLVREWL